jgi:hypothetical protein
MLSRVGCFDERVHDALRDEGTGGGATGPFAPTRQKLGGGVSSPCGQLHTAAYPTISQTAITDLWYHYS